MCMRRDAGSIEVKVPFEHGELTLVYYARVLHKVSHLQLSTKQS